MCTSWIYLTGIALFFQLRHHVSAEVNDLMQSVETQKFTKFI